MRMTEKSWFLFGQTAAIIMIAIGGLLLYTSSVECANCPTFECYGKCFTPGCICMSKPGEPSGSCYGVSAAEELASLGWERN